MDYLPEIAKYSINQFDGVQQRMWQILQFTIWLKSYKECGFLSLRIHMLFINIGGNKKTEGMRCSLCSFNYRSILSENFRISAVLCMPGGKRNGLFDFLTG